MFTSSTTGIVPASGGGTANFLRADGTWQPAGAVSTYSDSAFRIQDNADATKQIAFEASGITTATTRTFTAPDASGTLALIDVAQSFTASQTFSGTGHIFGTSVAVMTVTLGGGATASANTKTVNIGTGGLNGSIANITLGSSVASGVLTVNSPNTYFAGAVVDAQATLTAFANTTTLNLGYGSTLVSTTNISTGATAAANTKTVNIGTGGAASSITNINFGAASGTGTATFNNDLVVTGNLTINGTTTTMNSTTLTVDDKNIELGSIGSPTNITADGGGITLKGASDKTFNWINATGNWTSSEGMELALGKSYSINGGVVLSNTTLGSTVLTSSLTTVGTIGAGVWQGTVVAGQYGGTGINNSGKTITLGGNINTANSITTSGNFAITLTATAGTTVTLPITGTLATLAGVETLTNKTLTTPIINYSTAAGITAGTNAQGQGALTNDINIVTITGSNPSGVTLPTATVGRLVTISNRGTTPVNVYPATGGTIDSLAANASISLLVGELIEFFASTTTQWYAQYGVTSSLFDSSSFTMASGLVSLTTVDGGSY